MNKRILLHKKYEIELFDRDISIPLTYELIDIKNLNKRSGSKSKTITVPRSKLNDKLFGIAGDINAINQFSKIEYGTILIEEDSYIIFDGLFQLTTVTESEISFFCFAEVSKFKGLSGTKRLQELQLDDLNHTYDASIFDTWDGIYPIYVPPDYFYPVIDYGQFENRTTNPELQTQIFITDLYPALYLERAIRQICLDNGYSLVTTFFDDPIHTKMLLPFCNEQFIVSSKYAQSFYGVYVKGNYTFTPLTPFQEDVVPFTAFIDGQGQWDGDEYTAAQNQTIRIRYDFFVTGVPATISWPNASKLDFVVQKFDAATLAWSDVLVDPVTGNYASPTQQVDVSLLTGDQIRFVIRANDVDTDFSIEIGLIQGTIIPQNDGLTDITVGGTVTMAPNLPDMKQIDLFTYCYKLFDWVIYVNDSQGVIYIESYDDYYAGNTPKDYSLKLDLAIEPIRSYRDEQFSRSYQFSYNHDDNDYYLNIYNGRNLAKVRYPFGDGDLILSQQDDPVTIGPIGFSPTVIEQTFLAEAYKYINLPVIWRSDREVGVKKTKVTPRLLINAGMIDVSKLSDGTVEAIAVQTLGTVEEIPLCYFQKIQYDHDIDLFDLNLSFSIPEPPPGLKVWNGIGLITKFYEDVIKDLSASEKVTAYFHLTAVDISTLDFSVFWYVDYFKAFFRLNRIRNYQPSSLRPTQVELIKVGVFYEFTDTFINFEEAVFRITEAGDIRQLENDDLRILE